jgi:hypothetical protein
MILDWDVTLFGVLFSLEISLKIVIVIKAFRRSNDPYFKSRDLFFLTMNGIGGLLMVSVICFRESWPGLISCNLFFASVYLFQALYYLPFIVNSLKFLLFDKLLTSSNKEIGKFYNPQRKAAVRCLFKPNFYRVLYLSIVGAQMLLYLAITNATQELNSSDLQFENSTNTNNNNDITNSSYLIITQYPDIETDELADFYYYYYSLTHETTVNDYYPQQIPPPNDPLKGEQLLQLQQELSPDIGDFQTEITKVEVKEMTEQMKQQANGVIRKSEDENNYTCFTQMSYAPLLVIMIIYESLLIVMLYLLRGSFSRFDARTLITKAMVVWLFTNTLFFVYEMLQLPEEFYYYLPGGTIIVCQIILCDWIVFIIPLCTTSSYDKEAHVKGVDIELDFIEILPTIAVSSILRDPSIQPQMLRILHAETFSQNAQNDYTLVTMIVNWKEFEHNSSKETLLHFVNKFIEVFENLNKNNSYSVYSQVISEYSKITYKTNLTAENCDQQVKSLADVTSKAIKAITILIDEKYAYTLESSEIKPYIMSLVGRNTENLVMSDLHGDGV